MPDDQFDFPVPNYSRPLNNWLGVADPPPAPVASQRPPSWQQAVAANKRTQERKPPIGEQLHDILGKTGQFAAGVATAPINMVSGLYGKVSAADEASRNPSASSDVYADPNALAKDQNVPATALGLMGAGVPFARPGALGSAGGKSMAQGAAGANLADDTASRIARADAMGFRRGMPLYHGSDKEFSAFRAVPTTAKGMETPGVSAALDPDVANEFAGAKSGSELSNPQVYSLLHRTQNPAVLPLQGDETHGEVVGTLRDLFDAGHDAVMLKNYTTPAGKSGQNIVIVRDANQLRSPQAMFDPARKSESDLLALQRTVISRDSSGRPTRTAPLTIGNENAVLDAGYAKASRPGDGQTLGDIIRAYHGSPHDFDKFDIGKIGTGEGAQAYGHGLYFAENEGVASSYRDSLAQGPTLFAIENGKSVPYQPYEPRHIAAKALWQTSGDARRAIDSLGNARTRSMQDLNDEAINLIREGAPIPDIKNKVGRMYEVAIKAHPDEFLDWDKPLSEQHPKVQAWAEKVGIPPTARTLQTAITNPEYHPVELPFQDERGASESLREAGIPGIKYLDAGSRSAGEGSHNYVVFHHDLIDILKKYGIAGIGALPAMGAYHFKDSDIGKQ